MTGILPLDGKRILAIVYGHVADSMAAVPALRSLRAAYPSARIEVLAVAASAPVFESCPYVDLTLSWSDFQLKGSKFARAEKAARIAAVGLRLRQRRYDATLVFHRSFRVIRQLAALSGAPVRVGVSSGGDSYTHPGSPPGDIYSSRQENGRVLESIGLADDGGSLEFRTGIRDEATADRLLPQAGSRRLVGLHPGSDWSCQQWLPERFASVGAALQSRLDADIVITGTASEAGLQREIASRLSRPAVELAGKTTLPELAAVIRRLDLLISVNSAPAAIAQAVGTRAVVLLGPEDARLTGLVPSPRLGVVQPGRRLAPGSWCEFGRWGVLSSCDSPMCRGISGLDQLDADHVCDVADRLLDGAVRDRSVEVAS